VEYLVEYPLVEYPLLTYTVMRASNHRHRSGLISGFNNPVSFIVGISFDTLNVILCHVLYFLG